MTLYLLIFVVATCGSLLATPVARKLAIRFNVVDHPGERKVHLVPTPYLGGIAIYVGGMIFLAAAFLFKGSDRTPMIQGIALVSGATLMVCIGAFDDRFTLPPIAKLASQLVAALLLFASGIHFHFNHFTGLDAPVSIVWVIGITNAVNLLDNMDGLAVGVAGIGCAYFFALAELQPGVKQYLVASLAIALFGACLGFLYYNFNPAQIFMGDAGSLFLGFMLAVIGLKINMNGFPNLHAINFFVPAVVLAVPIFDTCLVVTSRLRRHVPVSLGGRDHTSHRLLLLGLTVRETVLLLYLAAGACGLAGIMLTIAQVTSGILFVALVIVAGVMIGAYLEQVYIVSSAPASEDPAAHPRHGRLWRLPSRQN